MDANIILGWALLALALGTGSFFAAIVLAASQESERAQAGPYTGA